MKKGYELVNGQARAKESSTFEMPSKEDVDALKLGDYVKIGVEGDMSDSCAGERFWVRLTKIEASGYTGIVEQSDMLFASKHGVANDSTITFERHHILGIDSRVESTPADEAEGIKAIIYLQGLASITETEERARAGWAGMSDSERKITMETYEALKPKEGK